MVRGWEDVVMCGWWMIEVGGCEGVRVGGEDGVRNTGLTPGRCPRFSSSACECACVC